jgi:exopolysaccharide biosynthesis polyprenyl glycosylphosphotransferase
MAGDGTVSALTDPRQSRRPRRPSLPSVVAVVRCPLAVVPPAVVAFALRESVTAGLLATACAAIAFAVLPRWRGPSAHLPVLRVAYPIAVPAAVFAPVTVAAAFDPVAGLDPAQWGLVAATAMAASALVERLTRAAAPRRVRVAFIGDARAARHLAGDLRGPASRSCVLVGRIATSPGGAGEDGGVAVIGELGRLRQALVRERVGLVVLGGRVARLTLFDELAETCLDLPIQLIELAEFYEGVFGHVPTAEINAAWFAHLVDARARHPSPRAKRVVDVVLALVLGVVTLPPLAVLALLVRLDGGPAIFAQHRIGEAGRPFRLYKLRTMRLGTGDAAMWAEENDPRATRIGRVLRRWHVDELPQLWNVLRGEMSFVGPRPEQLEFVERLERTLPFYRRRHLTRPGLTGWAQVRCGYAGSEVGAAWKLCNDLYYVKYRSLTLDLLVLAETVGLLMFRSTADPEPQASWWADDPPPELAPVADVSVVAMGLSSAADGDRTGGAP